MLSIILRRNDEPRVVHLTQENLQRELSSLPGAELLVEDDWANGVFKARNDFLCLVEADCLVNSGYFASLMGLFRKNHEYNKMAMMGSAVGVNNWANRFFGYELGEEYKALSSIDQKKSTQPYYAQVAFLPGAVMRTHIIREMLEKDSTLLQEDNVVKLSAKVSLAFWDKGRRVYINPISTYVSTTDKIRGFKPFDPKASEKVVKIFKGESI